MSNINNLILACFKWKIYGKKSISFNIIRIISDSFVSILNPKERGCFYLQFISFLLLYNYVHGEGEGSNKLLYKEALPQGENPIHFT